MSTVIKVENLSKQYRLGLVGTGTLRDDLIGWWYNLRGKENPIHKIGEVNDRTQRSQSDYVWALQNINFEVQQGDVMGIIGRNGAGKSTLLKLLSRVTAPTTGSIKLKGRIASLLEVGTGFHPELTGKENIFLNGAILGMRKHEIKRRFDEIVHFAGVERYIDTPVKRYSSGMYVRRAFGVAAHLESGILIVDEVRAVGDAEFQKKCLGKMGDINKGEGRTILFVSHNMASVRELCNRAMILEKGTVAQIGPVEKLVRSYVQNPLLVKSENDLMDDAKSRRGHGEVRFIKIEINKGQTFLDPDKEIVIQFNCKVFKPVSELYCYMAVKGVLNSDFVTSVGPARIADIPLSEGQVVQFTMTIPAGTLRTGMYPLYFWIGKLKEGPIGENYPYDVIDSVYYLNITSDKNERDLGYNPDQPGGYFNMPVKLSDVTFI